MLGQVLLPQTPITEGVITVYYALAGVAILVGGPWAFFRFIRHRTFKRRIELEVGGEVIRDEGRLRLLATCRAKNIGLVRFPIEAEGTGLQVYSHGVESTEPEPEGTLAEWREMGIWRTFAGRELLEPGEPAEDQLLIELPAANFAALRLELIVYSGSTRLWQATEVVVIGATGENT